MKNMQMMKFGNKLLPNCLGGHNLLLIEKIKDKSIRKVYAENAIKNGWSRNVLSLQIDSDFIKELVIAIITLSYYYRLKIVI